MDHAASPPRADLIACIPQHAAGVGGSTTPAETSSLEGPAMECRLDPQVIADIVGASPEFANELVDLFVKDSWARVDALTKALEASDRDALRTVAHSLKGSAGTVGARRLATICHQLEQHALGSNDQRIATALVTDVRNELAALVTVFADAKLGTAGQARGAA
jgi:histidine phosphotransfer protein HptB